MAFSINILKRFVQQTQRIGVRWILHIRTRTKMIVVDTGLRYIRTKSVDRYCGPGDCGQIPVQFYYDPGILRGRADPNTGGSCGSFLHWCVQSLKKTNTTGSHTRKLCFWNCHNYFLQDIRSRSHLLDAGRFQITAQTESRVHQAVRAIARP